MRFDCELLWNCRVKMLDDEIYADSTKRVPVYAEGEPKSDLDDLPLVKR